jgi:transposase
MPSPKRRDLTDAQWSLLDSLISGPSRRRDLRGRRWKDRRLVLNGVLWVLRTGAPWSDLPERYPTARGSTSRWLAVSIVRRDVKLGSPPQRIS